MTGTDHAQRRSRPLAVPEAGEYLGVGERVVRRLILERRIRYYKLGSQHVRIDVDDLDAFLQQGRVDPTTTRRITNRGP